MKSHSEVQKIFKQLCNIAKIGQKYEYNIPVNILDSWKNAQCVVRTARFPGVPLGNQETLPILKEVKSFSLFWEEYFSQ